MTVNNVSIHYHGNKFTNRDITEIRELRDDILFELPEDAKKQADSLSLGKEYTINIDYKEDSTVINCYW